MTQISVFNYKDIVSGGDIDMIMGNSKVFNSLALVSLGQDAITSFELLGTGVSGKVSSTYLSSCPSA